MCKTMEEISWRDSPPMSFQSLMDILRPNILLKFLDLCENVDPEDPEDRRT